MRFIPTKLHAPLDYIVGAVLIAGPWIFQYSDSGAATAISIVLGVGLIAYSLFTNYELGLWKVAPMAVHNLIDIVAGALLAASPWLFGFADDGANFWMPFVVIGVAAIFLGLTTTQTGGYSYRKAGTPTTA
jgi:SPW repeat-containing protein